MRSILSLILSARPVPVCVSSRLRDRDCFQRVRYLRLRLPLGRAMAEPRGVFPRHRPLEQHTEPAQQVCEERNIQQLLSHFIQRKRFWFGGGN